MTSTTDDLEATVRGFVQALQRVTDANTATTMGEATLEAHAYRHDLALHVGEPCGCDDGTCPGRLT